MTMLCVFVSVPGRLGVIEIVSRLILHGMKNMKDDVKVMYVSLCPPTLHLFNLSNPTGHVMHQQFNIQQLYALPTLYSCVLYLSENKQRLVPLTA